MNLYTFCTRNFRVSLDAEIDQDPDLSWRDAEQVQYDADHGVEYYVMSVRVFHRETNAEVARDTLCGCGYSNPRDFVRDHRDPNPLNRNTIGRDVTICHYFPDMVRTAVAEARRMFAGIRLREVA